MRIVFILIGLAAVIWFGLSIANPETVSAEALLPIALMLWVALALGTAYTLSALPVAIRPEDGFRQRLKKRFVEAAYYVAILAMVALAGFAVFFSLRAVNLAMA